MSRQPGLKFFDSTGICESVTGNNCEDDGDKKTNIADAFTSYNRHNCALKLAALGAGISFADFADEISCCDGFHPSKKGQVEAADRAFNGVNCGAKDCCAEDDALCNTKATSGSYPSIGGSMTAAYQGKIVLDVFGTNFYNGKCFAYIPEMIAYANYQNGIQPPGQSTISFLSTSAGVSTLVAVAVLVALVVVGAAVRRRQALAEHAHSKPEDVELA